MASSTYLQLIECGEWLMELLNENITSRHLQNLAVRGSAILGIDTGPASQAKSQKLIEEILKGKPETMSLHDFFLSAYKKLASACEAKEENSKKKSTNELLKEFYSDVLQVGVFTQYINNILRKAKKDDIPWQRSVVEIFNASQSEGTGKQPPSDFLGEIRFSLAAFLANCGKLQEKYTVSEGKLISTRSFGKENRFGHFQWDIAIPTIFFKFLELGGQEYYGFCEHCDRFFTIKRKGRKKYCSDICRVHSNKAKFRV
jgi:hypothetical protein